MTPALKAMVEAMGLEMQRQAESGDLGEDGGFAHETGRDSEWHVGGRFDMEKVARAALGSVGEAVFRAGFSAGEDYVMDYEQERRGGIRDLEAYPDENGAWERYRASLKPASD